MTKILLIEDSKFLRLTAERALARAGYEMSSAADGEEALRVAREKLPDLILLDMLLPKMSGPDVLVELKKDPLTKAIPVVVMTGASVYAGIDANVIVHKPLDVERFISLIERYF